jgi:hypothetical protein
MPGSIAEATGLLDAYLARATGTGTGTSEAKVLEISE